MTESRWQQLSEQIRMLISRQGPDVGEAVELIVLGLLPDIPRIAHHIKALSKSAHLDQPETSDEVKALLSTLDDDWPILELVLGLMMRSLDGLLGQIAQMLQLGTPTQALEFLLSNNSCAI